MSLPSARSSTELEKLFVLCVTVPLLLCTPVLASKAHLEHSLSMLYKRTTLQLMRLWRLMTLDANEESFRNSLISRGELMPEAYMIALNAGTIEVLLNCR